MEELFRILPISNVDAVDVRATNRPSTLDFANAVVFDRLVQKILQVIFVGPKIANNLTCHNQCTYAL